MADFDFNESRRARVDVARGAFADDIPLLDYTDDDTTGGGAETSFIDPPEDVWEAQNETPSWAVSCVPSGVSQEDLADAQHTKALVDRWQRERGKVQQNLEFASSTNGDLWLRWGKQWLLLTNKNKPGEFLAPSTLKRYHVDVARALGVYKSTGLSPQDSAVLNKTDQQVDEAASAIETVPLENLGQTIIKVEAAVQTAGNIFALPERAGVPPMTQREFLGICRALETIRGEHTNNIAKLTELDKHIALEERKLEEAPDETTKNIIAERLRNLQDERAARLEAASATREALRSQISRIRETLHRILHEDKTLAERIKTLFPVHSNCQNVRSTQLSVRQQIMPRSEDMSDISSEDEGQLQQKPVAEGKQGKPEPVKSPRTPAMSEEDSPHQRETQKVVGADESSPPTKVERSSRKVESSSPVKREVSSSRKVLMSRKGTRDQEESDEGRVEMTERERPILESESEEEDSVKSRVESKGRMGSSVSVVKPKESSKEQEESKDRRRRMEDTGRDDRISRRERDRSEDRRYDEQERSGRRREWMDPGKGRGDAGNVREYNGRRKEDKSKQSSDTQKSNLGKTQAPLSDTPAPPKKPVGDITTKAGGAYIPPAKLRMMQEQITDKTSSDTQKSNLGKTQAPLSDTPAPPKKPVGDITTKAGGAYIPPAKLRMMQEQITDKSSVAYQRMSWEALKKSITGLINKVNVSNIINIIKELFQENIVRGRGLLAHSVIQAQAASPTFTHVYAALVAIINTKFPQNGELILRRLILMFCRDYRRNDKAMCLSSTRFIAHLVNQQVAHEVLALEIFTLLLETPTDDSVEIAIGFLKECGQKLTKVSPSGINSIFEWLRIILHEGMLGLRVEYMVETMFAIRKDGFQDHQAVLSELDLVEEEEQFTHVLQVKDAVNGEEILNVFKEDNNFAESEEKYKALKKEILEEGSSDEESEEGSSGSESSESDEEAEEREKKQKIIDQTETNLVALRRVIYLTIQSSLDHNECAHKLLKMDLKPGQEVELCNMILDCCAQLRTYEKFFGLLAERVCQINKKYIKPFQQIFVEQYETIHSLETNKLRKVAKFFAHMLHTDAISWGVLSVVKLTEEDMIPASRIFLKILFQELSEYLGLLKLNQRLKDSTLSPFFEGIMPRDNPKNTRFSINFFTTIGLGGLTDDLREHLKKVTKKIVQEEQNQAQAELAQKNQASPSSSSSSDDSDSSSDSDDESSSSDSSDSESDSVGRGKKKTALSVSKKKKPSEKSPIKKKVRKEDSWKKTSKERVHSGEAERKTGREDDHPSRDRVGKDKHGKDNKQPRSRGKERQTVNGRRTSSPEKGISIAARLLSMAQYGNIAHAAEESMPDSRKNGAKEVSRGEERFRDKSADKGGRRHRDISPEEQLEGRDRAKGRQRKDESEYRSGKRKEDNWKKNRDREEEEIDRRKQGDRDYHEKIRRERYDTRNQRDWGNIEKQNGSRPMGRREERDTREGYKNHEVGRGRIDKGRKDESNMRDNIEKGKPREQKGSRGKGSRGQDMEEKRHQRHDSSSSGSNSNSEDSDSSDGSSSRKPIKADGITNKYVSNGKAASSDRKRERTSPSPAKGKRPRKDCSSRSAS
ncbi:hypothetical protein RRG08_032085 [Elysia crispata]|uniref:MI domain-containing protein n=1 Tax=Elysia crispata TaxID=231223 RepID=A0AAE0ZDL2_9GAST|nr:hypothetical protein RRG08_032085 [Elysia crispata]